MLGAGSLGPFPHLWVTLEGSSAVWASVPYHTVGDWGWRTYEGPPRGRKTSLGAEELASGSSVGQGSVLGSRLHGLCGPSASLSFRELLREWGRPTHL